MAIFSKREFSELCGIQTKALSVYIKRGKVIPDNKEMIDDSDPINKLFSDRMQAKLRGKGKRKVAAPAAAKEKAVTRKQTKEDIERKKKLSDRFNLDTDKQVIATEKLKRETYLLELQHQKLLGKLIPTDLVRGLFAQHFKSVTITFKQAVDKMLTEFSKKAKLDRNGTAELRMELIAVINKAVEDGINESKKNVDNIVSEYSQKGKKV